MRAAVSLLLAAMPLVADFEPALWRWRKPIAVESAGRVSAARLDKEVLAGSRSDRADLRLVREGAEVPYVLDCGPERDAVAALAPERSEDRGTSNLIADLGARLPFDQVRLVTPEAGFYRTAAFDISDDRKHWQTLLQRPIYRVAPDESLAVSFCLQHSRYLRVRIFNRDDRPIAVAQLVVEAPRISVKFLPKAAGAYWLYYGNRDARAPGYDLGVILARRGDTPLSLAAGPVQANPDFRPPAAPWTERRPEVLYIALALAALALSWVVIRFWIRVSRAGSFG